MKFTMRHKVLLSAMVCCMLFASDSFSGNNVQHVCTRSGLNMRENPDTGSKAIVLIPYREKVAVIDKNDFVSDRVIPGKTLGCDFNLKRVYIKK
jgi:hypothetical protein